MGRVIRHRMFRLLLLIALALLLVDAFFVAAEMMQRQWRHHGSFPAFSHPGWLADPDGSFAEIWGYVKALAAAALLFHLFLRRRRAWILLGAALLFVVVALDDMLQLHERGGVFLTRLLLLKPRFGIRGQDFGELLTWALLGVPLAALLLAGYLRSDPLPRRIAWTFVSLLFFAVAIDVVLIRALHRGWSERALYVGSLVELAGELLSLTAVLLVPTWFILSHRKTGTPPSG